MLCGLVAQKIIGISEIGIRDDKWLFQHIVIKECFETLSGIGSALTRLGEFHLTVTHHLKISHPQSAPTLSRPAEITIMSSSGSLMSLPT